LFKAAFGTPDHAADLFRSLLPPSIVAAIRWNTLRREVGSYINPALRDRYSDLLFSVMLGDTRALLYLLLEHQSTHDDLLLVRILEYLSLALQGYAKDYGLPLPLVIPVAVCHTAGGWASPRTFSDLFVQHPSTIPGLAELIPDYTLLLDDLTLVDDEELHRRTLAALSWRCGCCETPERPVG
jgi:hypothetical protein